jgi:trehalose/maltose transport system substrate-binding protein
VKAQHFPTVIDNDTVDGHLMAMPWFVDAGLLYYRKDLLEKHGASVPEQWTDLAATAQKIQDAERKAGNQRLWGFVFQGRAYEGLTVDALEWIASSGGGTIVDASGKVTVNNPKAVAALDLAASWVGKIAPEGVLTYGEEEARGVFQSGDAVFMRNWPYAWALANASDSAIRGKIGIVPLPKGGPDGRHVAALGGQQLAVSRYSKHPEAAADLVLYLVSASEQKRRAIEGSFNPTIESLYKDPEILKANPFMGQLGDVFANLVARPARITGSKYNRVSTQFFTAVHATLSHQGDAAANLARLEKALNGISRNSQW